MSFAYAQPEKESLVLVEFKYGDLSAPTYARYTDYNEDYVGGFLATPNMSIKLPENSGTFEERPLDLELNLDAFTSVAGSGLAHSPIYVSVREITRALIGGPQATDLQHYKGRVMSTIKNYQGRSNRVLLKCLCVKSRLTIPLASPANHHCVWTLFGRGCGLAIASYRVSGTITAIDGKEVTSVTPGVTTGHPDKYWHRGYISYDGLNIAIQNWSLSNPTKLFLVKRPPASWIGPTLLFVPGCDKTVEKCRSPYNNESNFRGVGYAIPAYNPLLEDPA